MYHPSIYLPVAGTGESEAPSSTAVILLHGRGQSTQFMIDLVERVLAPGVSYCALSPRSGTWYPQSFLAPVEANQPELDSALGHVEQEVRQLEKRGWSRGQIVLMGFSQGACLACEYLYRNPRRWGGLIGFTGGLIGPPDSAWPVRPELAGTPMLITNGDNDPWVPWARSEDTAAIFSASGADVELRLIPGRDHSVSDRETEDAGALLRAIATRPGQTPR